MNKKSIKIILCIFIILGIITISKNIYTETLLVEANNKDRKLFIEEGETVTLNREQIMGKIVGNSGTDTYKHCFIESYTVENESYIKVEGKTTGFGTGKNYNKITITGIKAGEANIKITSQGENKETRNIKVVVKKDSNINSYPTITVEDIKDNAAVTLKIEDIVSKIKEQDSKYVGYEYKDIHTDETTIVNEEVAKISSVSEKEYVKITGVSAGVTVLKIKIGFYKWIYPTPNPEAIIQIPYKQWEYPVIKYKVVVKDKAAEEKELESKIEDTDKTTNDMENAYKNIPNKNATAEEIDRFIKSDANLNGSKALNNITDEELLNAWETTIKSAMIDTISRNMYKNTLRAIQERKSGDNVDPNTQAGLSDQFQEALQATASTRGEYEDRLAELRANMGDQRAEVSFDDVLDNISGYKPDDMDDESAEKVETVTSTILTNITNIGIVVAIVILAILGIKYMIGSVEEKAEFKKDLIPYLIGALILFGITSFVKILMVWGQQIGNI